MVRVAQSRSVDFKKYEGLQPVYSECNVGSYRRSFCESFSPFNLAAVFPPEGIGVMQRLHQSREESFHINDLMIRTEIVLY
jgi:hypothetical protein